MTPGAFRNRDGNDQGYAVASHALTTSYTAATLAGDRWTLKIDTATNSEDYGFNMSAPATASIVISADSSTSAAEIVAALVAAFNADPVASLYGVAVAHPTATDTLIVFSYRSDVVLAEDENAGKMTLTHVTTDSGAVIVPPGARLLKLRAKLSSASTFVPGDATNGVISVFLAADAAGDIPITNLEAATSTAGLTSAATKGGISFSLDRIVEGNHADRVPGRLYVIAKCSAGTVTAEWFLDFEDVYRSAA